MLPTGMPEDERSRRVGENESAFRNVNERALEAADRLDVAAELVCECSRLDCVDRLHVPLAVYEDVRRHERRFLVAAGHERPEYERVVDQGAGWLIVEKTGEAGEVASERDPRGET